MQLQIALVLIGLGFISFGFVQVKRAQNENSDEKRHEHIITKLDEIQQELEKQKQPEKTDNAVADIIAFGLKYYAEHISRQEKEEP